MALCAREELLNELQTANKTLGIATLCFGGGQGLATILERLSEGKPSRTDAATVWPAGVMVAALAAHYADLGIKNTKCMRSFLVKWSPW